ncbi:hypothetical protein LAZ40_03380 [Cereibacter sphaeroides]|uniref:shufflon system plasmid conjugative transfer pilus tip adhesin PilV n=1 Tax=Cereibacter sphaeroides TaxID=1063 RepID=UPI001F15A4C1|nr:shufflon system plasmid conjugative transfer pilus tip adhesin PilV [Cereibacter sphaeroides]MCE6958098.1 hypothetical protein [Cereibacter sphaeroides]MCE6971415.1 hypothetical protein [Cereibacter sphaeroides]
MKSMFLKIAAGRAASAVPRPRARRARRGFSIPEMVLVLIVTAMILQTGIETATAYIKRQVTQRTAATLSRVADDVQTYMDRNYFTLVSELSTAPNRVVERSWTDLIGANLISLDRVPLSPDGGAPRLFFTLRGDTVYSVIMSFNGAASNYSPRPDPNTRFAGKVQPNAPTRLNGWDFSLDVPEIAALSGTSLAGNIGVIRSVSMDVDVDPYLHRIAVPGRPELNQMQADLDLGGFNIDNALTVRTQDLRVQDEMAVNGRLTAGSVTTTGDATVSEVNTTTIDASEVKADNANVTGTMTTRSAVARTVTASTFTGNTAAFTDLTANRLTGGTVHITSGNYVELNANKVDADQIIADRVYVGD